MAKLDPKDRASFDHIQSVIDRVAPEWRRQGHIMAVVPALKMRAGVVQPDTLAIGFHVSEKPAPDELAHRGWAPIPAEIEGIPTDVILARQPALGSVDDKATRSAMFDTLVGGIAVGNANMNVYGTLGMTLLAVSDGRMVGLTNEHVLVFDGDGRVGDEVQQPRFHLNSEVSLDNAACCPNGTLHYRGVDNPIVDASAAVFAAAAVAAALSDVIDPHRRGQDATVPDPGERTLKETVSVAMDYPEKPLPGRPYKLDVKWEYVRQTDRRTMGFAAAETMTNPHHIDVQQLLTDKASYSRGETVTFVARLGVEPDKKTCGNYFVTAAALSPSRQRAYKLILRPFEAAAGSDRVPGRRCVTFTDRQLGQRFAAPTTIEGATFDPAGRTAVFDRAAGISSLVLRFPGAGLTIRFPKPVQRVLLHVGSGNSRPIIMTAFDGPAEVGAASDPANLDLAGARITHVLLKTEALRPWMSEFCTETGSPQACLYRGQLRLAPDEELGRWATYLFAQTRNDVPLGTAPTIPAQTIGGLPVTSNFVDGGSTDNFIYGHTCNIDLVQDGSFEVVSGPVLQ